MSHESVTTSVATVVSSRRVTPEGADVEVRELVIDVENPAWSFEVGQSIGVIPGAVPGPVQADRLRFYSVADLPKQDDRGNSRVTICVRRTTGIASNFLCDLKPGDTLQTTGPAGVSWKVPREMDANLILIGTGTGIAPFRTFVSHLYQDVPEWKGRIWVFFGAQRGLELLYANDKEGDLGQYYDERTFEAFKALSPQPNWADPIAMDLAFVERGEELLKMMADSKTYVYVAGMAKVRDKLDELFATLAGSREVWEKQRLEMADSGRWVELLY